MIKKIKNFICKLLGIKQCTCPEEEISIIEETAKQKKILKKYKKESE